MEATAAHKGDQRGRVHGPNVDRPGHPAPSVFHVGPASIVEWSKAPGFILDPGPTPRCDPDPVSEAIGSPPRGYADRGPDRAVVGHVAPVSVVVKILVARHL